MTYTELQQYLKDCDLTSGNVGHLTHQVYSNIRSGDGANHKPFHNVHKPSINSIDSPPQSNSDPSSSTAPSGDDGSETETLIPPLIMWCEGVTLSRPSATFLALSTHYYYPLRAIADFDFCDKLEEALSPKPANLQTRSVTEVARLGFFKEFKNSVAAGLQRKRVDYPLCPHLHLSDILSGLRPPPAGARYSGNGSSSKSCPACHSSCSLLICPTEDAKIQHHKPTDLLVNAQNEEEAVAAVAEGRQIQLTVLPSRPPASPSSPATELPHAGIQLPCIQTTQKIVPKEQLGQYTLVITIRRNLGNLTNAMDPAWLNNLVPPNVIQSSHSKGSSRKEFVARYI
ncbi:MAG: hypothetical protein MMC23_000120 [Stictis urceolatum]|nr:hypothetical protein [Stictis urceolata]